MTRLRMAPRCACLLLSVAGIGLGQTGAGRAASTAAIELTDADLFAHRNWTSRQVSVLGFRLGMTWPEVSAEASARNLSLVGQGDLRHPPACDGRGWCQICEAPGLCDGLILAFGEEREIVKLSIGKVPDFASKKAQAVALQKRFRGGTRELFVRYSKELRLKLLGPESSQTTTEAKTVNFTYAKLGLEIQVAPCPKGPPESSCAGLTLEFSPPAPAN